MFAYLVMNQSLFTLSLNEHVSRDVFPTVGDIELLARLNCPQPLDDGYN